MNEQNYAHSQEIIFTPVKKFQIGIFTSWNNYFDGNPMIQTKYINQNLWTWLSNSKGVEFSYLLNSKNKFRISLDNVKINYLEHVTGAKTGNSGYIFKRDFDLYKIEYVRKLYHLKRIEFFIQTGFVFRKGDESILVSYGNFDILVDNHQLHDFGIVLGLSSNYKIINNLFANLNFSYQNYFYRFDQGNFNPQPWNNGSSVQSYSMSIGIDYQF